MDITIKTVVEAPVEEVWAAWTQPDHIVRWNFASDDWQCPRAELDLSEGGRFNYRMEAKDGSMGFDLEGTFASIEPTKHIHYVLDDDRRVSVNFLESEGKTTVSETFEAEEENSVELQQQGWQAILDNFKAHVEADRIQH